MMQNYNFDSHKLIYHTDRLNQYLETGDCFPLYMEISVIGNCNHRCTFCAYDYIGYPNRKIQTQRLLGLIDELAECGLKSLLYAGEGEPLLHPDIVKFIGRCKKRGIECGIYTNGQLLKKGLAQKLLPLLTFLRFSFNAGTAENYSRIHRVKPAVFSGVVNNMRQAVRIKQKEKLGVDIGLQYVLIRENSGDLFNAIKISKDTGIDYFVIKPYVLQSHLQSYRQSVKFRAEKIKDLFDKAENFSDKNFKVIARRLAFQNYGKRNYQYCYATSFISVVNSAGDVATCLPYWDRKEFIFGNIYRNKFKEIWLGLRRKKIKEFLENKFDAKNCPPNCRPHAINEFLSEIKNPKVKHINFI